MRAFNRCLGLLAASLLLASCGGGGGSGGDGAFQPTPSGTLDIRATTTQLPLNFNGVGPFIGSPYIAEVDVTWRRANGDLVSGQEVAVAINPVTVAAFSTLDDPNTQIQVDGQGNYLSGNEFLDLLGSGPVKVTGGHATVFVHADNIAGTATLTVTARDPASNTTISKTVAFTVNTATTPLPASIALTANPNRVYLQENGGSSSTVLSAVVRDGSGQLVPDPVSGNSGFNNLQLEIVGGANSGNLSAIGAGGAVSGATIKTRTVQGVAAASYSAGTIQGPVQIRATADRADGNVDNGISNPVTVTQTITVSDGKLFSLSITSPNVSAILANRVLNTPIASDNDDGAPPAMNGSYSLIVSALATDRQGNPVPAGTVVRFGAIDSPIADYPTLGSGRFLIGGNDGNPQESGTLFTSVTGCFTGYIKPTDPRCSSTGPGERPGPGDTLLTFGDLVLGNRDLESARTVASVNGATGLNVSVPFNRNDDTGNSVDSGPVIPYVIGRAQDVAIRDQGQISLPGLPNTGTLGITDRDGVASALLTYPVAKLGKATYIYAQSDGVGFNGQIKKVTDIEGIALPGVAPAQLTVNPEEIPGNATAFVTICIIDKYNSPLQGVLIDYSFIGLPVGGQGSVDGNGPSGSTDNATGPSGCVVARVVTTGLGGSGGNGGSDPKVVFSALGLEPGVVTITATGNRSLTAQPGAFRGGGGTITLTLRDAAGNPVPGVLITGQCTGDVGIGTPPGVTNAQGQTTTTVIDTGLNGYGEAGEGECTFTAASGEETTVTFQGIDFCESGAVSPPPPPELCGGTVTNFDLTVIVNPTAAGTPSCGLTVTSTPTGIACSAPAGNAAVTCTAPFSQGVAVSLTATPTGANCPAAALPPNPPTRTVTFSGQCAQSGALTATATMSSARTCNVAVTIP